MKKLPLVLILLAAGLSGCGGGNNTPVAPFDATDEVRAFREAAVKLLQREELDLEQVTIQFVLIASGLEGNSPTKPDLPLQDAENKAAAVFKLAREGEDFDRLVYVHSYGNLIPGQRPGMLTLLRGDLPPNLGPSTFRREQQETSVWKAAWRLQPGEIGAVEKHHTDANQGFYIVRRLTEEDERIDNPANFEPPNDQVAAMRADAEALAQRPEHGADRVKVQHLLIARYMSAPDGRHKILQPDEAEIKAAELYQQAVDGADFNKLVREHTYDSLKGDPPGVYEMIADDADGTGTKRSGMAPAFGDVAWRLKVGEIGVAPYNRAKSWYGHHIVKRLE